MAAQGSTAKNASPGAVRNFRMPDGYRPRLVPEAESLTVDDLGPLLRNNKSGRYLRLSEAGWSCLSLLDGQHTLAEIQGALEKTTGRSAPMPGVINFVVSLGRLGMLEDDVHAFGPRPLRSRLAKGAKDLMNIRFGMFPATRLLEAADRILKRIPASLASILVTALLVNGVLAPAVLVLPRLAGLHLRFSSFFGPHMAIVAILIVLEVIVHELAHGIAMTALGGEVREFGIGLQYLFMAYSYTNTTDGYSLDRRSRVWVSLAGPMVELALLGINAYVLLLVGPASFAGRIVLMWMAGEAIMLLFNVNPLLPVDGYYVLADLLREPALRRDSFLYLRSLPRRLLGGAGRCYSRRQHVTYLCYGALAALYFVFFLASAFLATFIAADPVTLAKALAAFPWLRGVVK